MLIHTKKIVDKISNIDPVSGVEFRYQILEEDDTSTLAALYKISGNDFAGDLFIPKYAEKEGNKYPVKAIGWSLEADGEIQNMIFREHPEWKEKHNLSCFLLGGCRGCRSVRSVTIPEGVEVIVGEIFNSLRGSFGSLLTVNLPSTIRYMEMPFRNCVNIEEQIGGLIQYSGTKEQWKCLANKHNSWFAPHFELYDNAEGINTDLGGDYTPYESDELLINFCRPEDFHIKMEEDYIILSQQDKTASIRIMHPSGEFAIPESCEIDGKEYAIAEISTAAFAVNDSLTNVTIPSTIKEIRRDGFYDCKNLDELIIDDSDEPLHIDMGAFFGCQIKRIYIGRDTRFEKHNFTENNLNQIEEVIIRKRCDSIAYEDIFPKDIIKYKDTLEDFIYDHMEDEDLIYKIEEQLDAMPHCRKSAEELLDTVKNFDGFPEIYKKLFALKDFLTEEEVTQVKEEYESNFDLEYVGEIDD